MPPPAQSAEREEERRHNTRTLAVASLASATAAAVTSQLWIAGTWVAAAVTPVLVALISEAVQRPTERIARAWTSERDSRGSRRQSATRAEPSAMSGTAGPVRMYRQTERGARPTGRDAGARTTLARPRTISRRRIAIGTVAVTGAIAFVIGIALLTTVDLVSGGSVGKGGGRTTAFGGGGSGSDKKRSQEQQDQQNQGGTQQQQSQPEQQNTTRTQPPPTTEQPAPNQGTAPSDTAPVPPAPSQSPLPQAPTTP
jgi:hypothetical protein